ncbi:hypothetical protein C9374_014387 [Naegleria lovaniensis]|uniref:Uncharacterized protein n=1 Tax=Naegleria lovaniensis TaxID=51637 RepID=A0AA88GU87_NAELO|nr:uncharacterized protein C9374_014387 [Naegleria lovaniensis]KAG2388987.1 hypothetical protein C9374_014387 [Naegleria lovaniensis]
MQQRFDLMLLLFASSGVLLSFILIRMDPNSKHETDPLITRELASPEHSILFFIHMFLKSVGLNHVKFFQWRALMEMKQFYMISLCVHSITAMCWILLLYFGNKNSESGIDVNNNNNSQKQQQQQKKIQKHSSSSSSSFSWLKFVLNAILIMSCVSMLFILSLVYLPLIKNGIQLKHHQ